MQADTRTKKKQPPFSKKQKHFYRESIKGNHRWNIQVGAVSSGKTYLDFFRIPVRISRTTGAGEILLLGNSQATIERNILTPMRRIWGDNLIGRIKNDNRVMMFGKPVYAIGADMKPAVDKIRGMTVEYCYGDEVATWAEEVFQMVKSRLRTPNACFDGTANPEHPEHWLKKFMDSDADVYVTTYQIDDNPFLPASYIAELKKEYYGTVWYDRFILGLWVAASGAIYPQMSARESDFLFESVASFDVGSSQFYVSCDYGTANPTVFHMWRIYKGVAYCEKEYYWDSRKKRQQKTDEEYADDLEAFCDGYYIKSIIIDPSAASFRQTIRKRRKYQVIDADNDVLDGIRITNSLLSGGMIKLHKDCTETRREMKAYLWDEKRKDGVDAPIKENDHAPDSIRYFSSTVLSRVFKWVKWGKQNV